MNVRFVDFFAYQVKDLYRSVEFYRDCLGLPLLYHNDEADWAEFVIDGMTFSLCGPRSATWRGDDMSPAHRSQSAPWMALAVSDLENAVGELRQKGLTTSEISDTGVCRYAVIYDPDDNALWLHEGYADYHKEP